jgi:hypothetical protein
MPVDDRDLSIQPRSPAPGGTTDRRGHFRKYSEVYMFSTYRPIAAMMAAVATSVVFTVIELLLRYAAR